MDNNNVRPMSYSGEPVPQAMMAPQTRQPNAYLQGRLAQQPEIMAAGGIGQMDPSAWLQMNLQNKANYNQDQQSMQGGDLIQNLAQAYAAWRNQPPLGSQLQ